MTLQQASCKRDDGAGFLLGAGLTTLVAVLHNGAKDQQHRQEVSELVEKCNVNYRAWQYNQAVIQERNAEIERLHVREQWKDTEIARLKALVDSQAKTIESQAKALSAQKVQLMEPFPPQNGQN